MSSSTAHENPSVATGESSEPSSDSFPAALPRLLKPLQVLGFWAGVGLPFLYVPLLVTGPTETELFASLVLIAVHAVALVVGHAHDPAYMA